jgi:hypothetical protein
VVIDKMDGVATLLDAMREAGADQQALALAARAAASVALDSLAAVARLLGALREAGMDQQALALAARAAANAPINDWYGVTVLLGALREASTEREARRLVDRLPAEGWFDFFRKQPGHANRYRFGREPDGTPAPPWGWNDLD